MDRASGALPEGGQGTATRFLPGLSARQGVSPPFVLGGEARPSGWRVSPPTRSFGAVRLAPAGSSFLPPDRSGVEPLPVGSRRHGRSASGPSPPGGTAVVDLLRLRALPLRRPGEGRFQLPYRRSGPSADRLGRLGPPSCGSSAHVRRLGSEDRGGPLATRLPRGVPAGHLPPLQIGRTGRRWTGFSREATGFPWEVGPPALWEVRGRLAEGWREPGQRPASWRRAAIGTASGKRP
jgi:hypothetical protein